MTSREWQPGDVAMVLCSDGEHRQATCELRHLHLSNDPPESWPVWRFPDGMSRRCDESDARPLVVIDPEQTDLYLQSDGRDMTVWHDRPDRDPEALLTEKEAGPVLWAHLKATLPTRDEPQDEPTDPGVRVLDCTQGEWARVGEKWVSASGGILQWEALCEVYGPLEVIQPDAPSADERPFKVGTRVQVRSRIAPGESSTLATTYRRGLVIDPGYWATEPDSECRLVRIDSPGGIEVVHISRLSVELTPINADAPC